MAEENAFTRESLTEDVVVKRFFLNLMKAETFLIQAVECSSIQFCTKTLRKIKQHAGKWPTLTETLFKVSAEMLAELDDLHAANKTKAKK